MHVITRKRLLDAAEAHGECATAIDVWFRLMKHGRFETFAELRETFRSVHKVGDSYVFNVGGNKLRVVCAIHFNTGKVFIRHIMDHKTYDTGAWKR